MHISLSLPLLNLNLALTRAFLAFLLKKKQKIEVKGKFFLKKKGAG
jgi:O-phosphoseryl-tRNA(Cys) synthetase